MRKVYLLIIAILITISAFSTGQTADILIYKGKRYELLATPLESYPDIDSIRDVLFWERQDEAGFNTACWRAYRAEWTIEDNHVFLTNIYSCEYYRDSIKANLQEVFKELCVNNSVKADWISHELLVADGREIIYHHNGFERFYEKEKGFFVENGRLTDVVDYDNSMCKKSEYFDNPKLLFSAIYPHIRWNTLPDVMDKNIRVIISFSSGKTETPENVEIVRGADNPVFDEEAKRIVGLLKWNVYYKKGKPVHIRNTIPVVFSNKNKEKYARLE